MPKISIILLLLELEMGLSLNLSQPLIAESSSSLSNIFDSSLLLATDGEASLSLSLDGGEGLNLINSLQYPWNGSTNISVGTWFTTSSLLKNIFLLSSLLSLIIGTVVGLCQIRIKRLLAYSTVSHIGFLLLALAISSEQSTESLVFYLIQYTITNLNAFFILLAFGYIINSLISSTYINSDIKFIFNLKGQFLSNPILSLSLAVSLFSMAGIPPLIGFFGKQSVLFAAIGNGYYFMAFVAILVSVISASYYLRIIRELHSDSEQNTSETSSIIKSEIDERTIGSHTTNVSMDKNVSRFLASQASSSSAVSPLGEPHLLGQSSNYTYLNLTNIHAFIIASLTLYIIFYVLKPSILLNSAVLSTLSLFNI